MVITEQELKHIQQEQRWCDDDIERFKDFIETYPTLIPDGWSPKDVADEVSIFDCAEEAFWFMEEGQGFAELATFLAAYDLSNLKEGQRTLAEHLIDEHDHYFKVDNGYVFFTEGDYFKWHKY